MLLSMGEVGRETGWRTCMYAMYLDVPLRVSSIRAEFHGESGHGIGHLLMSKSGCRRSVNRAVQCAVQDGCLHIFGFHLDCSLGLWPV